MLEPLLADALAVREADGDAGLQRFLDAHPEHATRLRQALADLQRMSLLDQPEPDVPERFGEFVVERELGAGGMGVVYVARQESLARRVALKIVRPELLLFDRAQLRFRREIDAIARVEHPAIVPVLATGSTGGVSYYAMPLLEGRNGLQAIQALRDRDPRRLTGADLRAVLGDGGDASATTDDDDVFAGAYWQAVVRLLRKAALGIQQAHERDILHRDLKPSNVMLTPDGRAIVLDFGLSHTRSDEHVTQSRDAAGSPAYMSPEVLRGEPADERTDVYGLAITLHALLALAAPFATTDPEELRRRILAGDREPLRGRRDLPPELLVVLACGMERDRLRRYPSPRAFADDLQAVLDHRPITARRLPLSVRARRFAQRHQALASAALVALVSSVALFVTLYVHQREANAMLEEQTARSDQSVAVSMEAVHRLLAGLSADRLHNAAALDAAHAMLVDAREVLAPLTEDKVHRRRATLLRSTVTLKLLVALGRMGKSDEAEALARAEIAAEGDPLSSPQQALLSGSFRARLAALLVTHDRFEEAARWLHEARKLLTPLLQTPLADDAAKELRSVETDTATLMMGARDAEGAEAALRRAIEVSARIRDADDAPEVFPLAASVAQLNLVRFLKRVGKFDEAERANDELLAGLVDQPPDVHRWPSPEFVRAMALNERANLMQQRRRDDDAILASQQLLPLVDQLVQQHPQTPAVPKLRAGLRGNLGLLMMRKDRFQEATPLIEGAIADAELALRASPGEPESLALLAYNLRLMGGLHLMAKDWQALEATMLRMGAMRIEPQWRAWAAGLLLDVPAEGDRRTRNVETALQWLERAVAGGYALKADDRSFDAIRERPRFRQLVSKDDR
ncbi:MAG: serine/threonine protein kinase [Planctomycetes bacterium]|nr:serine/threonine protein kinase [Planctomycetota bacterium]